MKRITSLFLSRYLWFRLHFNQWFKNLEGIKAFSELVMNTLLRKTLGLAKRLKKRNKELSELIHTNKQKLDHLYTCPYLSADEYTVIGAKLRLYNIILFIAITGEGFFNYFASRALLPYNGIIPMIGQIVLAILITWLAIFIFEEFCEQLFLEQPYKSGIVQKRNWKKFILVTAGCLAYEILIYYLCKVRGISIEGIRGNGDITIIMMFIGMLIPIIAGYLAYKKRRYIGAYKTTSQIYHLQSRIAKMRKIISTNNEILENYFKHVLNEQFSFFKEFKTYKENYNFKHDIPIENLDNHFCYDVNTFGLEAIKRYKKPAIHDEIELRYNPALLQNGNGHEKEIIKITQTTI